MAAITTTSTTTLTDSQERVLSVLGIASASLSICGSALIITRILRCKTYIDSPYNRIMVGLSVSDIISSFANGFGVFFLPKQCSPRVWAMGNETTCNMLGFLTQLGGAAIMYNGLLSLYYFLTVRFGVKRSVFASKYELWFHLSVVLYYLGTSIAGLAIDLYGELEITQSCWATWYPTGCEETDSCKPALWLGLFFGALPAVFVFFELPITNLIIYCHVRKAVQIKATNLSGRTSTLECDDEEQAPPTSCVSPEWEEIQKERVQEVAMQGFLYVAFFYVAYFPAFIVRMWDGFGLSGEDEADIYWLLVWYSAFLPLQGWFNLFIFMRPNYTRVRKVCPQQGIWWAMKAAWWERKLPTLEQSHDISRRTNQSASQKTTRNIVVPPYKEDPSSRKTDDQGLPVNKLARPSARSMMDTEAQADAFTAALTTGMRSQERKKHLPFKLPYPTASEGRSVTDDEDRICRDRSFQDDASTSPS